MPAEKEGEDDKWIKSVTLKDSISKKIFGLEKLVFDSYQLACIGGGVWVRHALLSQGLGSLWVWFD